MVRKSRVALVRCESYDEPAVLGAVQRGMSLLGGMASVIQPDERILLKPNVLVGDTPGQLVSPHPLVFKAVAQLAQAVTPHLSYGDSPGFGRPGGQMRKAGFAQHAQALGIPLADFEDGREVDFGGSPFIKRFVLARGVLEADGLISIAKFKTHGLTRITGAIKNQFGCVPGMLKAQFHIRLPNPLDFAKMLVCLNLYIRPRLCVVDGITAMEGNGPRSGDPVHLKVLLFSRDAVALDATMCRLIDLDPEYVPTMVPGRAWGLGTYLPEEIELVGDPLEPLVNRAFNVVRAPVRPVTNSAAVSIVRNLVSPRPVIDAARCSRCGTCVHICPATPKAVGWYGGDKSRPPRHRYERCVRCYCCQEVCPERAISVKTPLLGRVLWRL
jgi:uncharacterized protein (DUF362 family)/Pyruvate/2-oxoacid:ferredoxin oxidoreductase delta subunit